MFFLFTQNAKRERRGEGVKSARRLVADPDLWPLFGFFAGGLLIDLESLVVVLNPSIFLVISRFPAVLGLGYLALAVALACGS